MHPRIGRDTLYGPLGRGGLNLLDIKARNEAIDLIWARDYLALGPGRQRWAYVADVLLARAVMATDSAVDERARINTFLQTWDVSVRASSTLSEHLRRMIKCARKYRVTVESLNPAAALKRELPLWYHIGRGEERYCVNTVSGRCLRENHNVRTVLDGERVARRLTRTGDGGQHTTRGTCRCADCTRDRIDTGCTNPHRCAVAARTLMDRLLPRWRQECSYRADGLTLTLRRRRENIRMNEEHGRVLFDPSISDERLQSIFQVFGPKDTDVNGVLPVRRPAVGRVVEEEGAEVFTDGSAAQNGTGAAKSGSGVWFGHGDGRNLAAAVPGSEHSNQRGELFAVVLAAATTAPFAPLHIVTD
ncbi:hypothetical protein C8Q76DRAFT_618644, partial [Earliella scabrosa]